MSEHNSANLIRRLPASVESAPPQLAAAPALLADVEQRGPVLRWYQIAPPALLLGVGQRLSDIDLAACAAAEVAVYRRGSGGGAVLSGKELLLLDLALPREHPLALGDITESYRWLGEIWVQALGTLGIDAQTVPLAAARADVATLNPALKRVCFGGLSPYEVVSGERKVVGLAQIRRRSGALFQAGIYLHWRPEQTAALIMQEPDLPAVFHHGGTRAGSIQLAGYLGHGLLAAQLADRVAGLDGLGRNVGAETVIAAVEAALAERGGLMPLDTAWSEAEQTARETSLARYGERLD